MLLLLLMLSAGALAARNASAVVKYDSSTVQLREPSADEQRSVYEDGDYNYEEKSTEEEDSILARIFEWLFGSSEGSKTRTVAKYVFLGLGVLLLVWMVLKITRTDITQIFFRRTAQTDKTESRVFDVDINEIDFSSRIAEAIRNKDYRLAVRLEYLYLLKKLSDRHLISWRKDLTNFDYYLQLGGKNIQDGFREVSLIYDYCWYGDIHIGEQDYHSVESRFKQFSAALPA